MTAPRNHAWIQTKLHNTTSTGNPLHPNIEASGDYISDKSTGSIRLAFQNVRGTSTGHGLALPTEIEVIDHYGIDIMGMAETNRPWSLHQRATYDAFMTLRFHSSRTIYTAAPALSPLDTYQPGGNLLSINGHTTGRISGSGSDPWGRFCWYSLRGRRDEGVIVITAYRVCQEKHNNPGPLTAFQQQYTALRRNGVTNPNPRQQILMDICTLITEKRKEGLRPILLIDANGDYLAGKDSGLASFLHRACLADPFHDKFKIAPPTYQYGKQRIDYIFTDPGLAPSIQNVGYLGTHSGIFSDHVMAYMDLDEASLFAGIINRPPGSTCERF